MSDLLRLLRMARPVTGRLVLAVVLGAFAAFAAVGLIATSAYLISQASEQPPILTLSVAIVGVRFFGVSRGFFRYLERLVGHDAAFRVLTDVRVQMYEQLERLAPTGVPAFRSGDLLARLVADVDTVQELYLRVIPPFSIAVVVGTAAVALVGWLVPSAGLVLAAGLVVAGFLVPWTAARVARRSDRALAHDRGALNVGVVELVRMTPELVVAGAAPHALTSLEVQDDALRRHEQRTAAAAGLGAGLTSLVTGITVLTSLAVGALAVTQGRLDGVLLAVVVLTPLAAFELVTPLPAALQQLSRVQASARRLFEVVDATPPVSDPVDGVPLPADPLDCRVTELSVRWTPQGRLALQELSFDLPAGRRLAIVGQSGAGKSTVAAALLRFVEVEAGGITLNGVATTAMRSDDVRTAIGLLSQEAHLFDSTLAENLLLARRDADEPALREALASAGLKSWVDGLPEGLTTRVGEHGVRLSGGQRQRVALARVLLADFPIVVLDEPGEHLDTATADALMHDLLLAVAGRTTVVITHRLAGLEDVDEIIVLRDGRATERGGHTALLAAGGWYANAWSRERSQEL
ncbi:MAG: thiol reductant ABC exporter subunit CydC [Actinomycetes bacterium]